MSKKIDTVIIGGGIYGSYAASYLAKRGIRVLVIECDNDIFSRASKVNQARLHNGMHYPRAKRTIESILKYRERFIKDFSFSINRSFDAYYAISTNNSLTSQEEYSELIEKYDIKVENVNPSLFFKEGKIEALYKTCEYTFDYNLIKNYYYHIFNQLQITLYLSTSILNVNIIGEYFILHLTNGEIIKCKGVINATYSSINSIDKLFDLQKHEISYELCELSLCKVPSKLFNIGLTIMDGPFFSIMPFGFSNYHSLSSVNFTPHFHSESGEFSCMKFNTGCNTKQFLNCDTCLYHPSSAFEKMNTLYKEYISESLREITHIRSLYSIKPILKESTTTDDRHNEIYVKNGSPFYISALAGKFFTFYELDSYIEFSIENYL